jgi:regulator of cell morphogenesis and NO signaling
MTLDTTFDTHDTLNTIVERAPQTLEVLKRMGLDTCCGGALPLETAARHHDLDPYTVLAALRAVLEERR